MNQNSITSIRSVRFSLCIMVSVSIFLVTTLVGCGSTLATPPLDGKMRIVTTTTLLYDVVTFIGGENAAVISLMGPGIDPHLYQASAGDVIRMQDADIIVYNGLHLEGKMGDIFAALARVGRDIICIEDGIEEGVLLADEDNPEIHDPHIWFDVSIWMQAAEHVAMRLAEIDEENAAYYIANLNAYLTSLAELDQYIKNRVAEVPQDQRVLVTAHDAFRYFGVAYGFEVMGLQGISTDAEAGTADVSNLAALIAERRLKAIFIETSVPARNIEALQAAVRARGFAVSVGGELYSDSLGDPSSGHDTYVLTFKANIDAIVDALK